jgi:4-hydroxy-2-oxoheptanedioate aldolase
MRPSKILAKIRSGKVARICCVGHFLPFFPKHAAHFGYDGVWVDAEHRAFDAREAQALIAFHHLADIDCIWRPPTLEKSALYRLLEDGATGLMIPQISSLEAAKAVVEATRFPPIGERGLDAAGLDADFMTHTKGTYLPFVNAETVIVLQIETPEAVDNAEAIASVPGVDVLFIGPGDLSLRLGCSPAVSDPQMLDAQKKVAKAAAMHGKAWGRPVSNKDEAQSLQKLGARFLVLGSEFWAVYTHLSRMSSELDEALGEELPIPDDHTLSVP